jgi:hypothetical protein
MHYGCDRRVCIEFGVAAYRFAPASLDSVALESMQSSLPSVQPASTVTLAGM